MLFRDANTHFETLGIHKSNSGCYVCIHASHIIAHGALVGTVFTHSNLHYSDTYCCKFIPRCPHYYGCVARAPLSPSTPCHACIPRAQLFVMRDQWIYVSAFKANIFVFLSGYHSHCAKRTQSNDGMIVTSAPLGVYECECAIACVSKNSGRDTALL